MFILNLWNSLVRNRHACPRNDCVFFYRLNSRFRIQKRLFIYGSFIRVTVIIRTVVLTGIFPPVLC